MKKVLGVALAMLLVVSAGGVWAGEVGGKIQKVDPADRIFVLEDGTQLWMAAGLSMDALKEGASVKVTYEERDGKKIVTGFEISQ
ncbi:MAG: DUF1344 domain-containing protein [Candidatus Rokubacteria bacterium]|nr:DUF1344 domain-containing protein [Candidatus Rokubacteria bacterium]